MKDDEKTGPRKVSWFDVGRNTTLAAGSITASVAVTFCSLAAMAVILRMLPREAAGRFAILVELLYAIGLLGSLGQSALQARLYQKAGAESFDWRADLWTTVWFTFPIIALGVVALQHPYDLTTSEIAVLSVGGELFVLINCLSAVLAQQQQYAWSSALLRLPNGLLALPAGLLLWKQSHLGLRFVLGCLLLFLALAVIMGARLLARQLAPGIRRISFRERTTGLIFLASLLAVIATQRGLIAVAGAFVRPEEVAALAALLVLLRVFDLVGEPAGRVYSTELARDDRSLGEGLPVAPWLLAGALALALLLGLPLFAHYFYSGRYDAALPLLPWLVLSGALRFVEIVPRGFLAYRASTRLLNWSAFAQGAVAAAGLGLMVRWTVNSGLPGTVRAGALIAAARLGLSYFFYGLVRRNETKPLLIKPLQPGSENPPI